MLYDLVACPHRLHMDTFSDPSGASSIEWFHQWMDTGDESIRQRILAYNEDDCRATRVLREARQRMAETSFSI